MLNSNQASYLVVFMKRQREQIRLNNLEILIAEVGSATKVAQLAGTSESYLSQVRRKMLTQSGNPRGLGNELTAKLEKGLGKPEGWMDEPHDVVVTASGNEKVRSVRRRVYAGEQTVAVDLSSWDLSIKAEETADVQKPVHSMSSTTNLAKVVTLCPLVSWAQACEIPVISQYSEKRIAENVLPCPVSCSPGSFVLRVKGASMETKFGNGDLIFVDPQVEAESGKYVVVKLEDANEATFKQLIIEGGRKYLKALNPDWPERIIEIEEQARICGVVVFKGEMI